MPHSSTDYAVAEALRYTVVELHHDGATIPQLTAGLIAVALQILTETFSQSDAADWPARCAEHIRPD